MSDPKCCTALDSQVEVDGQAHPVRASYVAPSLHWLDGSQTEAKPVPTIAETASPAGS